MIYTTIKRFILLLILILGSLIASTVTSPSNVHAAGPTGSLSCAASTVNSITVGLSYSNTGTAGVGLYRYGAPGNGQIAKYPGASGSGRHVDTGLSGSYRYQLRSGTSVLANIDCVTKPVPPPATAPAPAPTPPPPAPQPTPAPVAPPAPPVVEAPAPQPVPEPTLPSEDEFQVEQLPEAASQDDEQIAVGSTEGSSGGLGGWIAGAAITVLLAAVSAAIYVLIMRHRNSPKSSLEIPRGDIDALSLPTPVSSPSSNQNLAPQPVAQMQSVPSKQTDDFNRSIDKAFYPSRKSSVTTLKDEKADDIPDMYSVANQHPESFGNSSYSPVIASQPPAGPSPDPQLKIADRRIVTDPPPILRISH